MKFPFIFVFSPGHSNVLQALVQLAPPRHGPPPSDGAGSLHCRVLLGRSGGEVDFNLSVTLETHNNFMLHKLGYTVGITKNWAIILLLMK